MPEHTRQDSNLRSVVLEATALAATRRVPIFSFEARDGLRTRNPLPGGQMRYPLRHSRKTRSTNADGRSRTCTHEAQQSQCCVATVTPRPQKPPRFASQVSNLASPVSETGVFPTTPPAITTETPQAPGETRTRALRPTTATPLPTALRGHLVFQPDAQWRTRTSAARFVRPALSPLS